VGKSAYIKLVNGSVQQDITLDQIKALFQDFIETSKKTGEQLDWEYENTAFPYDIIEKKEGETSYLYLKAHQQLYNFLIVGIDKETVDGETRSYIQIVLPDEDYRTPGDQSKGNVFAKYLARKLKAELHLFNGRVQYFNPRK